MVLKEPVLGNSLGKRSIRFMGLGNEWILTYECIGQHPSSRHFPSLLPCHNLLYSVLNPPQWSALRRKPSEMRRCRWQAKRFACREQLRCLTWRARRRARHGYSRCKDGAGYIEWLLCRRLRNCCSLWGRDGCMFRFWRRGCHLCALGG